jgi:hypothetical protein
MNAEELGSQEGEGWREPKNGQNNWVKPEMTEGDRMDFVEKPELPSEILIAISAVKYGPDVQKRIYEYALMAKQSGDLRDAGRRYEAARISDSSRNLREEIFAATKNRNNTESEVDSLPVIKAVSLIDGYFNKGVSAEGSDRVHNNPEGQNGSHNQG